MEFKFFRNKAYEKWNSYGMLENSPNKEELAMVIDISSSFLLANYNVRELPSSDDDPPQSVLVKACIVRAYNDHLYKQEVTYGMIIHLADTLMKFLIENWWRVSTGEICHRTTLEVELAMFAVDTYINDYL